MKKILICMTVLLSSVNSANAQKFKQDFDINKGGYWQEWHNGDLLVKDKPCQRLFTKIFTHCGQIRECSSLSAFGDVDAWQFDIYSFKASQEFNKIIVEFRFSWVGGFMSNRFAISGKVEMDYNGCNAVVKNISTEGSPDCGNQDRRLGCITNCTDKR